MHTQRGSILVFAVLILAVMLTTSLSLARIFAPKLRSIVESENSAVAIFGADTASEACLFEARKLQSKILPTPTPIPRPLTSLNLDIQIASRSSPEVLVTDNCIVLGSGSFRFRATGTYRGVSRALEVNQ